MPQHHLWYPEVASMRVKQDASVEFIPSLIMNHGALMSPPCV